MASTNGRTCETCVYVYRPTSRGTDVMLIKRVRGHNAGKWVPLGKPFGEAESPHGQAAADLLEIGLPETPQLRGLATEICAEGGWQYMLFLFAVRANEQWIPADHLDDTAAWHHLDALPKLERPQADCHFDVPQLIDSAKPLFEATMHFSGDGILRQVIRHGQR